jgi:YtxH-like protein
MIHSDEMALVIRFITSTIYCVRRFTMSEQGKYAVKVAAMVAGSAIVGAGIGLLFAPKSGPQTRRDISRYARKAQVKATRWSRSIQSNVKDAVERSRDFVQSRDAKPMVEVA